MRTGWGDCDENKLLDYDNHIYWEPDLDLGGSNFKTLKLLTTTSKIVEDTFFLMRNIGD